MRPLSPIRSASPISRPRITFNYPPSPLKQQHPNTQIISPQAKQSQNQLSNVACEPKAQKFLPDSQKCTICTNIATHKSNKEGNRYCSSCALLVIKKGVEVVRIDLKQQRFYKQFQQRRQKQNNQTGEDKIVSSRTRAFLQNKQKNKQLVKGNEVVAKQNSKVQQAPQIKLEGLLKESKQMKKELQFLLQKLSNQQLAQQGIKKIYKDKKLGLKKHYELIKTTIKLSIEKDLEELELREKKSMKCLQQVKTELSAGINSMDSLKHRIQHIFDEISYSSDLNQISTIVNQATQCVTNANEKKAQASQIVSQLAYNQGSESQGDSLHVRLTQQQLQQARPELYNAMTYTLLQGTNGKGETLFSFEHKIK